MKKHYLLTLIIAVLAISCKKENISNLTSVTNESNTADALSEEHVLTEIRTLDNTLLAVEYQLNEDMVDSNTYYGEVEGGNDRVDEFQVNIEVEDFNNITGEEQITLYEMIEDSVNQNMSERYDDVSSAAIRVIDVEINEELTVDNSLVFNVRLISFFKGINCGCTFTTSLPWALDDPDAGCGYANIKIQWMLNNYCAGYEQLGRIKYDFKSYLIGTFVSASTDLGNVELDDNITTTELGTLRSSINTKFNNYKTSTSGRNKIVNYNIVANFPWFPETDPNSITLTGTYYKTINGSLPF